MYVSVSLMFIRCYFFFQRSSNHQYIPVLTHPVPTLRSSDPALVPPVGRVSIRQRFIAKMRNLRGVEVEDHRYAGALAVTVGAVLGVMLDKLRVWGHSSTSLFQIGRAHV